MTTSSRIPSQRRQWSRVCWTISFAAVATFLSGCCTCPKTKMAFSKRTVRDKGATPDPPKHRWRLIKKLGQQPGFLHAVAFGPEGRLLATAGSDGLVILWSAKTLKPLRVLAGHRGVVRVLAFNQYKGLDPGWKGRLLASAGDDNLIRLWDVDTGQLVRSLPGHRNRIIQLRFGEYAFVLASLANEPKTPVVRVWDWRNGKLKTQLPFSLPTGSALTMVLGLNVRSVIVGGQAGTLVQKHAETGQLQMKFTAHFDAVGALAISPQHRLAASGADYLKIWDIPSWRLLTRKSIRLSKAGALCFSPDGKLLAVAGGDGRVRLLSTSSWDVIAKLPGPELGYFAVAFSPDGRRVAAAAVDTGDARGPQAMVLIWERQAHARPKYDRAKARGAGTNHSK